MGEEVMPPSKGNSKGNANPATRVDFQDYLLTENKTGSNRASSYIRAIDLLDSILSRKAAAALGAESIWTISSAEQVHRLYQRILEQQRLGQDGIFAGEEPVSYWRDRFCSAALKCYKEFLVIHPYEQTLWDIYNDPSLSEDERAAKLLETEPSAVEVLIDQPDLDLNSREGRDVIRETKSRRGQGFFRKMILHQYEYRCCVTGLDLPDLCIASHIIRWTDCKETRLDPRNGLCLSATYDKAFDKHLITFDEDYRLVVSRDIREHYRNDHARELFEKREGQVIHLPPQANRWPLKEYLEVHRGK